METKMCNSCKEEKDLSEFYFDKKNKTYNNPCKVCAKIRTANRISALKDTLEYKERERERAKAYYHTVVVPKKPARQYSIYTKKDYKKMTELKYPEKKRAVKCVHNKKYNHGDNHHHHWSYNKQHVYDWILLAPIEHKFIHKYIIYDQEQMMYRNLDGILLDTKESHIEYFEEVKLKYDFISYLEKNRKSI